MVAADTGSFVVDYNCNSVVAAAVAAVVVVGTAGLLYHCCSRLCLAEV